MELRACARGCVGKATGKAQGMETEACMIVKRTELFSGIVMLRGNFFASEQCGRQTKGLGEKCSFVFQLIEATRRMGDMQRTAALPIEHYIFSASKIGNQIDSFGL